MPKAYKCIYCNKLFMGLGYALEHHEVCQVNFKKIEDMKLLNSKINKQILNNSNSNYNPSNKLIYNNITN